MMHDYMRALHERFFAAPECAEPEQEAAALRQQLLQHMNSLDDTQGKKWLLCLLDVEAQIQDDTSLASFIAGFRLAFGIARELSDEEPYSFDGEQERRRLAMRSDKNG